MACMTCVSCGEGTNDSKCPACGSNHLAWDEENTANCGSGEDSDDEDDCDDE